MVTLVPTTRLRHSWHSFVVNRLFISWASPDSSHTDALVELLCGHGYQTWRAPTAAGDPQWAGIDDRISECDVFIVVLTEAWLDSEPCRQQLRSADARHKPVLLVRVEPVLRARPPAGRVIDGTELLDALGGLREPTMGIRGPDRGEQHHRTREPAQSWDLAPEPKTDHPHRGADAGSQLAGTVFAPATVEPDTQFLVQVFAHLPEHQDLVAAQAGEFDAGTHRLGTMMFQSPVLAGQQLAFQLLLPGLVVDQPVQTMVWVHSPQAVQFGVTVPPDRHAGAVIGTVIVSRDAVPIGQLKFTVRVDASGSAGAIAASTVTASTVTAGMHHYRRAFVSYSSADRAEVLKRTQMLAEVGIEFFQDILSLEPGDRWEPAIYQEIDRCDLFLLFWSTAAKASEWVAKEWRYALNRHGGDETAPPQILPVIIEGPPPVSPPAELRSLHFNDPIIYFIAASLPKPSTTGSV